MITNKMKISEVVNEGEKKKSDCLQCRIVGTGTMTGLAIYSNHLRLMSPINAKGNRLFYGALSFGKS
jgi:hypothetical protein